MTTHDEPASFTTPAPGSSSAGAGIPFRVALRSVSDPPVVRLFCGTRIREEIVATTALDGLESGGYIFSAASGPLDELVSASGAGDGARRSIDAVNLDHAYIDDLERELRHPSSGLVASGTWHTHRDNDPRPSDTDLRAWGAGLELVEEREGHGARFFGVIATTSPWARADWSYPEMHAFVTRRDPITGEIVCERAKIEED